MAVLVFSAVAARDSGQSDMRFSLSHQRDTNTPFLDYSTHHRHTAQEQDLSCVYHLTPALQIGTFLPGLRTTLISEGKLKAL